MHTTHKKLVLSLFGGSVITFILILYFLLLPCYRDSLSLKHFWSLYCHTFHLFWWIIYFSSRRLRIWSLRMFLDERSAFRLHSPDRQLSEQDKKNLHDIFVNKVSSTLTAQTIFIAIVALFLTPVLTQNSMNPFQQLLQPLILVFSLVTVILMVLAIDLLDTVANLFRAGAKSALEYQQYFYRELGPAGPKGGISYAYFGYSSFLIFFILSLAFFDPLLAGVGLSLFTYLAYPVLFAYRGQWEGECIKQVEIDEDVRWPGLFMAALFIVVTLTLWYRT